MRRKRFCFIGLFIVLAMAMILPLTSAYALSAAGSTDGTKALTVTLPTFEVTLNGQKFENQNSQYPLFVYRDITYVPMTYYDCQLMGLKTQWDQQTGLSISKNDQLFYEYERELSDRSNGKIQYAQLPGFPIQVNGESIDNETEEYPILLFRNVTYFPLTWRYAVNEFGWKYHFDPNKGLTIDAPDVVIGNPNQWREQTGEFAAGSMQAAAPVNLDFDLPDADNDINREIPLCRINNVDQSAVDQITLDNSNRWERPIKIDDFQMEYQIYKQVQGRNELVYRMILPTVNGTLAGQSHRYLLYPQQIEYWKTAKNGTYLVRYLHPDQIHYQFLDSGEEKSVLFKDALGYGFQAADQYLVQLNIK